MTILFVILIIVASVILGLIVLIQNPKGGGLSGSIAGIGNQFMGVKQTTDVLEKGTWVFGGIIALLCLLSAFFIQTNASGSDKDTKKYQNMNSSGATTAPVQDAAPFQDGVQPQSTAPQDTTK